MTVALWATNGLRQMAGGKGRGAAQARLMFFFWLAEGPLSGTVCRGPFAGPRSARPSFHFVVLGTQLMHRCDHRARVLRRNFGVNTVAQVEHMTVAVTVAREHARDFVANSGR
jgi:hypothetical protein